MQIDTLTLERYLTQKTQTPVIKSMLESLNTSPEVVVQILTKYFNDMGIYVVHPGQEKAVHAALLTQIKASPELKQASQKSSRKLAKLPE